MLSSPDKCPVCRGDFVNAKYLAKPCPLLSKNNFSFVESICNQVNFLQTDTDYPYHAYFQITSLYGELLFQKIDLLMYTASIEVNYVLDQTVITYLPKADIHCITLPNNNTPKQPEKITIQGKKVELDYPLLRKTINKIKTLAPFI